MKGTWLLWLLLWIVPLVAVLITAVNTCGAFLNDDMPRAIFWLLALALCGRWYASWGERLTALLEKMPEGQ